MPIRHFFGCPQDATHFHAALPIHRFTWSSTFAAEPSIHPRFRFHLALTGLLVVSIEDGPHTVPVPPVEKTSDLEVRE